MPRSFKKKGKKEKGGRQGGSEGLKKKEIRMTQKQEVKFEKTR